MFHAHADVKTLCLYTEYMDSLAHLVGCHPRVWTYLFQPSFLWRLMFGSNIAAQYRLRGPHAEPALARRVVMHLPVAPRRVSRRLSLLALAAYSRMRALIYR